MSNFHVGQRVVCIRDWDPEIKLAAVGDGITLPELHAVYTVRGMAEVAGHPVVYLGEVVNPVVHFACGVIAEAGWDPSRFRPVVERKTDISIFKAMLEPKKARVTA